ncbi:MAG: HlyD family efflux transporter periplasmic adaptor subunit [Flavobacterium sp.]
MKFKEGQIYSDTPQLKINAPNEVKILKTLVKEGQEVKKGDTLFILENKRTKSEYDVANMDVSMMQNKIDIIHKLIASTQERKNSLQQLLGIQSKIYNTDRKKAENEISSINNKIKLTTQQTSILNDKYKTDSLLYAKGAISKYELTETKNKNLDDRKIQVDINSSYNLKNYDFENLANNYQKTNNDLKRGIIDIENQIQNYQRDIVELLALIEDRKYNLTYIADELEKLMVISPINGTISNLFNAKQNLEIINKGDVLTIIAPKKEQFYAKIILNEKDLAYIKKGQEINLKLDAYNYYKYGAIKGRITYVSPSDVDRTFYCLANMEKYNSNIRLKAGYILKGEVIIEKMRLFQYIIKKLFNKIGDGVN